jgi:hypothetical protein
VQPAQSGGQRHARRGVCRLVDGHCSISTSTGGVVWDYDTVRPRETVNGVPARGGRSTVPARHRGWDGLLNSGYTVDGAPGNVVLARSD